MTDQDDSCTCPGPGANAMCSCGCPGCVFGYGCMKESTFPFGSMCDDCS